MTPLSQNLVKNDDLKIPSSINWGLYSSATNLLSDINAAITRARDGLSGPASVGVTVHMSAEGTPGYVAFCMAHQAFLLQVQKSALSPQDKDGLKAFCSSENRLVGFSMARIAMHLKHLFGVHVIGLNLDDVLPCKTPARIASNVVAETVDRTAKALDIDGLWNSCASDDVTKLRETICLRAWVSYIITLSSNWSSISPRLPFARTDRLSNAHFRCLYRMLSEVEKIEAAKPQILRNDFSSVIRQKSGQLIIQNERFKTRVRQSNSTQVVFVDHDNKQYSGHAMGAQGKRTFVQPHKKFVSKNIKEIHVVGREELTAAERARDQFLLHLLQGEKTLTKATSSFVPKIWFPARKKTSSSRVVNAPPRMGRNDRPLNQSQANVVEAMVVSPAPVIITHGPPGTGKTSTISVAVREWTLLRRTSWVVAQSNVGVKNIAESLFKHNVQFRLLVSKDFFVEWHEHIYEEVKEQIIRTDELPGDPRQLDMLFESMQTIDIFKRVPMVNLVIDEASQIGVFDFMHLLARFKTLEKLCFFGDPEQLPPYGKDAAPTLQSIFDVSHLKDQSYFLDTQYRMPVVLGDFISAKMYSSKLKSVHNIATTSCLSLIDVGNGEEKRQGKSWKNPREVQSVVHLVRHYYGSKEYCILSPYDAQRAAIEKALKAEGLRWDNVYNVDSFQGNEADFVLVSVVRTGGPGFLKCDNRVNVMLTRCKKGMVIVTNRAFTHNKNAKKTLLGKLVTHWEEQLGSKAWCSWKAVADRKTNLPGATGKHGAATEVP